MVDVLGHEIHVGDRVLWAHYYKDRAIEWSIHRVVGFTPQMIKIDSENRRTNKGYSVIGCSNVIVVSENDWLHGEVGKDNAS